MMTRDRAAPGILVVFLAPLSISATVVAPFIVLQLVNRRKRHEEFPFVLFTPEGKVPQTTALENSLTSLLSGLGR